MPNVWHHTTPVEVLLAPNRASKDLLDFNRDPTPRECCLPLVRPAQLKPPRRSVLSPLPEQAHSPTKHGREKLDSPIGKRGSEHSKGAPLRKPLKADRVRRRPQMLEATAGLSEVRRGRPAGMLDHTTMCIYEHGSDIGPGGLPSKPVGNLSRKEAVQQADRKIEEMREQQRVLQRAMAEAPPIVRAGPVQGVDPRRSRILSNNGASASMQPPPPPRYSPILQTQSETLSWTRRPSRLRCSSAEPTANFEVSIQLPRGRPQSSPPRRRPNEWELQQDSLSFLVDA